MSSFALVTQFGPPDLLVEVGKPISSDPVLLSGLFSAIVHISQEVTSSQLQVIQTKGYVIQFRYLENGFLLAVGTDHAILGLETLLLEIQTILDDGYRNKAEYSTMNDLIAALLKQYLEDRSNTEQDLSDLPPAVLDALSYLHEGFVKIIMWGILSGYKFRYPKTPSLDNNNYISTLLQYFETKICSELDPECKHIIEFHSRDPKFELYGEEYDYKTKMIHKTGVLKDLMDLYKDKKYKELRERILITDTTLNSYLQLFENYKNKEEREHTEIDNIRYLMGIELEHYLLNRLKLKSPSTHSIVIQNTKQVEWMSTW